MKTIIDYRLVADFGMMKLEAKVKNLMKEGWQPLGPATDGFMQTMVKYDDWDHTRVRYFTE